MTMRVQLDSLAGFPRFLTDLVEVWPAHAFDVPARDGNLSLGARLCLLRDIEAKVHGPRIRQLLWSDNPVLVSEKIAGQKCEPGSWRVALYELFQTRLGNVATLRRIDPQSYLRSGTLPTNKHITLAELITLMDEHDIGQMAQLFQLACECGAWPEAAPTLFPMAVSKV